MLTWYCRGQSKKWLIPADWGGVKIGGEEKTFSRGAGLEKWVSIYLEDKIRKRFLFISQYLECTNLSELIQHASSFLKASAHVASPS